MCLCVCIYIYIYIHTHTHSYLVCLIWMVLDMGGRWPYKILFLGRCFQDLFNISCSIFVQLPSSFFSICLVSVYVVHPYSSMDIAAWKKLRFILLDRSDFHMTDNLLIADHAFASHTLIKKAPLVV